jgi:hypothetical protein
MIRHFGKCMPPPWVTPLTKSPLKRKSSRSCGRFSPLQVCVAAERVLFSTWSMSTEPGDPDAVQIGVRCFECCFVSQILTALLVVASFDAPRETFDARVLNSITSKFFTILRGPIIFRQGATCGTSISLAQALPQASALIGPQKASIL